MDKILFTLYVLLYGLVFSFTVSAFMLFRPFTYVENDHTYILCHTNQVRYETSPNLIYAIETKLDSFNDAKARKLCTYHIISDYINMYKVPKEVNYTFLPDKRTESGWLNALFGGFLVFLFGSAAIEAFYSQARLKIPYRFGKPFWNYLFSMINT
ncbi:hypothetical protein A2866_03430 [Candidatus Roizmanbacteria bacterium RIFCSPHIGHO2_01_FULL_39_8]|uniref:Uncharacterized protein n=3 Tax=Candidatus Roizmaniibacteriota TaxID=1752723 RepID=A0A1F7GTH1_9BACT|nr:MAG: hypothetical protein A2866_03430 [Candidatus Roizmanbacteria bacterium RIFCSPHIGHO2_01_FULL_39_8]OGK28090.1 MAG: hypothetical protein A3C28_03185 [Candidatus Roizmanbacteria bacterium RIFCSPHIGHO2_02_FULL_39_9]OGK36816.1 MAG: hypothetical protein A3F60_04485 [Candidatus Roizmanbacteria bacterium RIFCSPHIGHO2_12_FULL_39_8]